MATTESGTTEECTCPLCGEYDGPPSSVEAHISRKTDDDHQGEVGQTYRPDLQGRVVGTETEDQGEASTTTDPEDQGDDQGEGSTRDDPSPGGHRSEDHGTELEEQPVVAGQDEQNEDREIVEESMTIPIPVSTTVLFTGVAALFAVIVLWQLRIGRSESGSDESNSESQGPPGSMGSGLMGGDE